MRDSRIVEILRTEYSLSELEDRLNIKVVDLEFGLTELVKINYEDIIEMLREDCFFS